MKSLTSYLTPLIIEGKIDAVVKRGRPPLNRERGAMTNAECLKRSRSGKREERLRNIAILDMETDPFDDNTRAEILPFVAELYSDQFGSIVIWDENFERFIEKLLFEIENLPDSYTIYAHNGGKFDFMFFVHKLRGDVKFKGRAIMCAKIGRHELRDSLHILPEKLAAWKKDHFDYSKLTRANRNKFKKEILEYLHNDCVYLFDIVKSFLVEFGFKISIGQAAFGELKKHYKTVQNVRESTDEFLRRYFFGGRVECLAGRGLFDSREHAHRGGFKLYDVNSMYPFVMANFAHPIGNQYNWRRGNISDDTVFIDVECVSHGAFVSRGDGLDANVMFGRGRYFVTKWEYDCAVKWGLIENVEIVGVVDNSTRTNFHDFIVPMYDRRQLVKRSMRELKDMGKEDSTDFEEFKKQDLFLKYLLNNSYGKFAQNPRNFKEYYYTDAGARPPKEWLSFLDEADDETRHKYSMPVERADDFEIWAKPSPSRRFNNVGTAASITGAARAVLMDAIQRADDPIYCDTDSLICRSLNGLELDATRLGAWDLEQEFDRVIIAGRKLYACEVRGYPDGHDRRLKIRSKGASGLVWSDFERMLDEEIISTVNKAPTISRTGEQRYMVRRIRATAPIKRGKRHAARNVQSA